ncbi:MAG: hypothetical protein ACOZCO_12645 [Bacteroidota bacterium]
MKDATVQTVLKITSALVSIIGLVLCIIIAGGKGVDAAGNKIHAEAEIGAALTFTFWLMIICVVVAFASGILMVALNFKKSIPFLIGIGVFFIICIISYSMASDEVLEAWKFKSSAALFTPSNVKWSDAGIIAMYFFGAGSILAILFGEISGLIKRFTK